MTAPAQQQMPSIIYKLDPETGAITRTDKDSTTVIAVYEKDTATVVFESKELLKFRSPTLQFLNDEQVPYKALAMKGAKRDVVDDSTIPPAPKQTIEAGDKTPAFVEWMKRYKPEEYAIRYGIRGEGEIQQVHYTKNEKTGKREAHVTTKTAMIADRKTHLTEKPEANDGEAPQG
jgi:hypothetical protein